ncbi:MAG: hypothetical protein ACRDT0_27065 [Pseudonocardiaceae bacterium]
MVETIECYVDEGMGLIWWQVCGQLGREVTLEEAEEWVAQQRQEVGSVEDEGGRHRWR